MPDSTNTPDATLTPYDPLNPTATPPSTMRNIMARYHADIGQQVDYTLADLQARWAPVRAALDQEIRRLTQQMEQALAHGDTLSAAWLNEAQRLTQLKGLVEGNVAEFAAAARSGIGAAQLQAIQSGTEAAQAALAGVVPPGVNYTFGVPPDDVLHQLAGAVQPYSPLSNLFEEFGPQASANAADALFTSVALGENPRMAAERLEIATNMPAQRAEVIARTEILRSWRGAQLANYRANSDVVQGWEWLCDHGPRSCSACLALDGTIHPLTEELDGHVMCRCSAAPLTGSWSDILRDAGVAEEDIPQSLREVDEVALAGAGVRQTGEEWLRGQSTEVQNLIMGPAKAEAWRQGAFQLSALVGVRHDPVWGSSIQELSLRQMGLDAQSWLTAAREGGSGSLLADEEALRAANAQTFQALSEWEQQRAAAVAEAEGTASEGVTTATPSEWEQARQQAIAESEGATPDAEAVTGEALQAEAAQMRELFRDDYFAHSEDYKAIAAADAEHQRVMAAAMGDNPEFQRFVAQSGYQTFEFGGQTWTPEMQAISAIERSWGTLVMDEAPMNVALRSVAQDLFGLELPARQIDPAVMEQAQALVSEYGDMLRAFVQNTYDGTQQWFAEQGITELMVYRGFTSPDPIEGLLYDGSGQIVPLNGAAFSSYSVDPQVAYNYAASDAVGYKGGDYRALVAERVPVSEIFATALTSGMPDGAEGEVLIFGSMRDAVLVPFQGGEAPTLEQALDRVAEQLTPAEQAQAAGLTPSEWERQRAEAIAQAEGQRQAEAPSEATTVTYASDAARERLERAFGSPLTDAQVSQLAGAPPGATVEVSRHGEITVTAPDGRYTSSVYLQPGDDGPTLLNWRFEGPDGTNAVAVDPEALATQVRQASALGVDGIHMKARSGSADYAELPPLGYNAPIEQVLTESRDKTLPPSVADAQTLLDVLATEEGRAWWSENGLNPGLDFDPHQGSLSWRILDTYLREHGLRGLDE